MLKRHLIKHALTGTAVIAAAVFPSTGQAGTFHGPPVCQGVCQLKGHMYVDPSWNELSTLSGPSMQGRSRSGFSWGDASVGAAGAAVLLGGAAAGVGMTRRRRIQRTLVG